MGAARSARNSGETANFARWVGSGRGAGRYGPGNADPSRPRSVAAGSRRPRRHVASSSSGSAIAPGRGRAARWSDRATACCARTRWAPPAGARRPACTRCATPPPRPSRTPSWSSSRGPAASGGSTRCCRWTRTSCGCWPSGSPTSAAPRSPVPTRRSTGRSATRPSCPPRPGAPASTTRTPSRSTASCPTTAGRSCRASSSRASRDRAACGRSRCSRRRSPSATPPCAPWWPPACRPWCRSACWGRATSGHCVLSDHGFDFLGFRVDRDYPRGAGPASVMHTAVVPAPVIEGTRRLLDLVGYRGPCSLSFIERDGRFMVHDVNLRLGATVEGSIRAGFDIPGPLGGGRARQAEPAAGPADPTRYVRFDGELKELVRAAAPPRRRRVGGHAGALDRHRAGLAPDGARPLALRPLVGAGPPVAEGPAPGVAHQRHARGGASPASPGPSRAPPPARRWSRRSWPWRSRRGPQPSRITS